MAGPSYSRTANAATRTLGNVDPSTGRGAIGCGSAATKDVGTAIGEVPALVDNGGGVATLPAVSGENLTGISGGGGDPFDWAASGADMSIADWSQLTNWNATDSLVTFEELTVGTGTVLHMRPIQGAANNSSGIGRSVGAGDFMYAVRATLRFGGGASMAHFGSTRIGMLAIGFLEGTDYDADSHHAFIIDCWNKDFDLGRDYAIGTRAGGAPGETIDGSNSYSTISAEVRWDLVTDVIVERSGTDLNFYHGPKGGPFCYAYTLTVGTGAGVFAIVMDGSTVTDHGADGLIWNFKSLAALPAPF